MSDNTRFLAGLYCRISRDEDDSINTSQTSIMTQSAKLNDFCAKSNIDVYKTYSDVYTGTSYDRPQFNQMIVDIENQRINCVIVKDLSRLGREYKSSGEYLENYFPKKGIRFIAIDDVVDLNPYEDNDDDKSTFLIPFYNLLNEFYPADISKKTRSALRTKAAQGQYLSSFAPFGYVKSLKDKNKLEIDESCAVWVRYIFEKFNQGTALSALVRDLHQLKVKTFSDVRCGTSNYNWDSSSVKKIVSNPIYLGKTTYGRTKRLSYKNKKTVAVNKENWIVVENTHEPIIQQKDFEFAQLILRQNTKRSSSGPIKNPLSGKVLCPDCENKLNFCVEIQ